MVLRTRNSPGLTRALRCRWFAITSTSARTVVAGSRRFYPPCAVRRARCRAWGPSAIAPVPPMVRLLAPEDAPQWGLQHLDLVGHPDRAGLDHPRADTTVPFEGLRHARFGKAFYIPANRACPQVLEEHLPHTESLAASQGFQAYTSGDDVAPVLAVLHAHAGLSLDFVEVLGRDEGRFADPAEAAPVPGARAVAVTLQAATFERGGRPNALHLRTSHRSKE